MNTSNKSTNRTWTIVLLSATLIFIVSAVIIGLCVRFLTEGKTQQVVLIVLICLLGVVGMSCVIILEVRRRRSINIEKRRTKNGVYNSAPTAPPLTAPSSWNYGKNYSTRTTVQA